MLLFDLSVFYSEGSQGNFSGKLYFFPLNESNLKFIHVSELMASLIYFCLAPTGVFFLLCVSVDEVSVLKILNYFL